MKIILTTGGTGGHIFPALALAEELRRRDPAAELLFIGSSYGAEKRLAVRAGIPFCGLPARGILGRGLMAVPAAVRLGAAFFMAYSAIRKFSPDAVAAFGSYASFAPALAGWVCGAPLLLHEQNAIAGSSNRILAKLAKTVCVSLPDTEGFSKNTVLTGNPVRQNVKASFRDRSRRNDCGPKRLLVLGGSQGAHALNMKMRELLPELKISGVEILHQTGSKDCEEIRNAYKEAGYSGNCVAAFIDDMGAAYRWADLALCRSGASTVAELCAAGLPAIFVPFPEAVRDHQTRNARTLEKAGAAAVIPQVSLSEISLGAKICDLLRNGEKLAEMSKAASGLSQSNAAALVADELEKII